MAPIPHLTLLGDHAVTITWPGVPDTQLPAAMLAAQRAISESEFEGARELVPGFASLTLHYNPLLWSCDKLSEWIGEVCALAPDAIALPPPTIEIPLCYDSEFGIDLADLATHAGLTVDEVIQRHSAAEYTVRMIGFAPGFPYLAGLPPELGMPRLATPRVHVPAGAVAIGGAQCGIYPVASPGGWRIIGQTPLTLFDPQAERPSLLSAGDRVRFRPITLAEFHSLAKIPLLPAALCPLPASLRITRGGVCLTVQDTGRPNWLAWGVPQCGALDRDSLRLANLLVHNPPTAAGLEFTLAHGECEFQRDALIAVTGADLAPRVDDVELPLGKPALVRAGAKLTFGMARTGCRAYLAIAGGIATTPVLGSRSTDVRSHLSGRPLSAGDELPLGAPSAVAHRLMKVLAARNPAPLVPVRWSIPADKSPGELRALRGPHFEWLTPDSQSQLFGAEWRIASESDRTGLRLTGPKLEFARREELLSTGTVIGLVQAPPSGQPLVLLNDGPPTGGYPQVAALITVDRPALAQLRPGQSFKLVETSPEDATRALEQRTLAELQMQLQLSVLLSEAGS